MDSQIVIYLYSQIVEFACYYLKMKLLVFTPFSGIWQNALLNQQLISLINSEVFEIVQVNCKENYFSNCSVHISKSSTFSKDSFAAICRDCRKKGEVLGKSKNVKQISIDAYEPELKKREKSDLDNEFLKTDFNHRGVNIFPLAMYETILFFKKSSILLNDEESKFYLEICASTIKSVDAAFSILLKENPDIIICESPQYAITGSFAQVAKILNIPVYGTFTAHHMMERSNSMDIWRWDNYSFKPYLKNWKYSEKNLTFKQNKRLKNHLAILANSKSPWVYSPPARRISTRKFFNIEQKSKILLVVVNSTDEIFAHKIRIEDVSTESKIYSSQVKWVKDLINWKKKFQDLELIIRLHPREFANNRENNPSESVGQWNFLQNNLPSKVHLDSPDKEFSITDHLSEVTAVTTGWSSFGIQAVLSGIPVVTYDKDLSIYPEGICLTGETKEEYYMNLHTAIYENVPNKINAAANWLDYSWREGSLYLGGGFFERKFIKKIFLRLPKPRALLERYFLWQIRNLDSKLKPSQVGKDKIHRMLLETKNSFFEIDYGKKREFYDFLKVRGL